MRRRLSESTAALRGVFRNPNLRRLQLAWLGSVAGQYSYAIAIAIYAYRHGGAAAVGVMALARTIPAALVGPFVAATGDRFRQERVMLVSDLLRAVLVGGIALLVFAHGPAVVVFVLAAFGPIIATAFHPAQAALLPALATTPDELTAANVSSSTIDSVATFAGPAIGGLILAAWGIGPALLFTVATYVWSALLIARVHPERPVEREHEEEQTRADLLAGFKTVRGLPALRVIVGLYAAQTTVAGAMGVLVVVAALRLFDLGSGGVGWLYSACGIGGLIGAGVAMGLVARKRLAGDFGAGLLLWGLPFLLMAVWPNTLVALAMPAMMPPRTQFSKRIRETSWPRRIAPFPARNSATTPRPSPAIARVDTRNSVGDTAITRTAATRCDLRSRLPRESPPSGRRRPTFTRRPNSPAARPAS